LRTHLSPLDSRHGAQCVAVTDEELTYREPPLCIHLAPAQSPPRRFFPWRQGSPIAPQKVLSPATSCDNSSVAGVAISDACTNDDDATQDMVLKLADRIAQLESQLHQQSAKSVDPFLFPNARLVCGMGTAAASKDQTELACAENGAILDRPSHKNEEPCSVNSTGEPSCSILAMNPSLFDHSIPSQAGSISTDVATPIHRGWYDRIRTMQLRLPRSHACDGQNDNDEVDLAVAITCLSDEVAVSIASDPALDPAVIAAMHELNERVAALEENRDTDELFSNDDPAVAETLRTLARRVMDLEHRRMTGGASQDTTPPRAMVPVLPDLEMYVAPLEKRNVTSKCSEGSSDFAGPRTSAPLSAKVPVPVEHFLLPIASSSPSTMNRDENLAQSDQMSLAGHLCEGAANVSGKQASSSKWADPSLGVVSSEASEAPAPRVPRGRFGMRPLRKCVGSGSGGRLGGSPARRSAKTASPAKVSRRE